MDKNEVLVRWLGWEQHPHIEDGGCGCDYCTTLHWYTPDGQNPSLPDLLHSLDAQAKWLVPKLNETLKHDGWSASWTPWFPPERQWSVNIGRQGRDEEYFGATLAEACAEAILSLIGEEKP